jgi:hypothetical protein
MLYYCESIYVLIFLPVNDRLACCSPSHNYLIDMNQFMNCQQIIIIHGSKINHMKLSINKYKSSNVTLSSCIKR